MSEHYFSQAPQSRHEQRTFEVPYAGRTLRFCTDAGVFSKQHVDPGSLLLCRSLPEAMRGAALDMGCGWGAMSVLTLAANPALSMTCCDVNQRALALCEENLRQNGMQARVLCSDGWAQIEGRFDIVLTNPPIRAGKAVVYGILGGAKEHLAPGGAIYAVIRKQQGAPSALAFLRETYPSAEVIARGGGYWILRAGV